MFASTAPTTFLGHGQTLDLMKKDYTYPSIGNRANPRDWSEQGALDITQAAGEKVKQILATHFPNHISRAIDNRIREDFPIALAKQKMFEVK